MCESVFKTAGEQQGNGMGTAWVRHGMCESVFKTAGDQHGMCESALTVTSIPPFIFPSITYRIRQFIRKTWPIQFAFHLPISCRIFLCSLVVSITSSFLTWSVQLISFFSNTTFQNFPGVSDLLPDASKFQQHIKLYSKCSILLASSSVPSMDSQISSFISHTNLRSRVVITANSLACLRILK
jgi:hypothetical protein